MRLTATGAILAAVIGLSSSVTTMYIDPDTWQFRGSLSNNNAACVANPSGSNINAQSCQDINTQRWMTGYRVSNPTSNSVGYIVNFRTDNNHLCLTAPDPTTSTISDVLGVAITLETCSGDDPTTNVNEADRQLWDLQSNVPGLGTNLVPLMTIKLNDGNTYCADICTAIPTGLCLYKSTGATGNRPCTKTGTNGISGIFTPQASSSVGPTSSVISTTQTYSATTTTTVTATGGTTTFTSDFSTTVTTTTATVGVFTNTVTQNLDPSVVTITQNTVTTTVVVTTTTVTVSDGGFPTIPIFPTQPTTDLVPPFTTSSSNPFFPPFVTDSTTTSNPFTFPAPTFRERDFPLTDAVIATEIVYVIPQPATTLTTTLTVGGLFYTQQGPVQALFTTLAPVQRREVAANIKNPINKFVFVPHEQRFAYSIQIGEYSAQWWSDNWMAVAMVGSALVGTVVASAMLMVRVLVEKKRQRMMEAQALTQSEGR
eukprot:comp22644_c0_seq1/m.34891 comp22644_c0_seq1/g.34891  ORF comp22644_c0_seq1/g.34891 comp22644_c0_seq1/m.34891 type:complete len:484 (-) comp22644_c0_seq1:162-1613(-)